MTTVQIRRKHEDKFQAFDVVNSTVTFQTIALKLGHDPTLNGLMLTAIIDSGRRTFVLATDEMTVVEDQFIEIDW